MSEQSAEETAKQAIRAAINTLEKANREQFLASVLAEYAGPPQPKEQDSPPSIVVYWRFPIAIIIALALAAWVTLYLGPEQLISGKEIDTKVLLTSLAFVVSLAAYLAGVVREIVKVLATETSPQQKHIQKLNIAWISTAEMQLVLLGVLIIVRVAWGPVWYEQTETTFRFDTFLLTYLGLILLFLSGLHARVWRYKCPFKFKQDTNQSTKIELFRICKEQPKATI